MTPTQAQPLGPQPPSGFTSEIFHFFTPYHPSEPGNAMSIILEFRGKDIGQWQLSTNCLRQAERLGLTNPEARTAIESLFGDADTAPGSPWTVPRRDLLESVKKLVPLARMLPGGFQIRTPPMMGMESPVGSGGVSGLLIHGRYYFLRCKDDHWTLQSIEDLRAGIPPEPRYDAAEVATENHGVYQVEPKKAARSDLSKVLRAIETFLKEDTSETIQIVWG